jgi:hypothetical protein
MVSKWSGIVSKSIVSSIAIRKFRCKVTNLSPNGVTSIVARVVAFSATSRWAVQFLVSTFRWAVQLDAQKSQKRVFSRLKKSQKRVKSGP